MVFMLFLASARTFIRTYVAASLVVERKKEI